jgi:tetratricopeptide (TPR) repeat protein
VVPYLEEAYPREIAGLRDWIEENGGVRLPLSELLADPRRVYVATIEDALGELATGVAEGVDRIERLFDFAVGLKLCDSYVRAQEVIGRILAEAPGREDALELRADVWTFQGNFADAGLLAAQIVARNPGSMRARATLIRAYEGLGEWRKVIECAGESLGVCEDQFDRLDAMAARCLAYWKLGKTAESEADLQALKDSGRARWKITRIMRERERA